MISSKSQRRRACTVPSGSGDFAFIDSDRPLDRSRFLAMDDDDDAGGRGFSSAAAPTAYAQRDNMHTGGVK